MNTKSYLSKQKRCTILSDRWGAHPTGRHICLRSTIVAVCLGTAFAHAATTLQVATNVRSFGEQGGESQSTVIAPGVKPQCPGGRVFVSDDLKLNYYGQAQPDNPPLTGLVRGVDLKDGSVVDATFDAPPLAEDYKFGSNDHDLISLANGDLLLVVGGWSKVPIPVKKKPAWFDVTYRGDFGPGARSALLIWRSTDGGQTFHFASVFDSAQVGDGSAALPNYPRSTTPPGSPSRPVFDMGGTDGQLAYADKVSGQIFLTHRTVGYLQDTSVKDHFELSHTALDRTDIAVSRDEGSSWNLLGHVTGSWWRMPVVRWSSGTLALARSTALTFGAYYPFWSIYLFNDQNDPIPDVTWGWDEKTFYENPKLYANAADPKTRTPYYVNANVWASTVMAPAGTSDVVVVAVPSTIGSVFESGHGYRVFLYDRNSSQSWTEIPGVLAENATYNTFTLHLTIIPGHGGPALLYWTEFNANTNKSTVRGRLVSEDGWYSSDFPVSLANGMPRNWSIDPHTNPWYGDYQTADSYNRIVFSSSVLSSQVEHHYFPMWVESDQSLRFTEVTFTEPLVHLRQTPTPNYVSNQSVWYYPIHANP